MNAPSSNRPIAADEALILRTLADALEAAATDIRAMLDRGCPRQPTRFLDHYNDASPGGRYERPK